MEINYGDVFSGQEEDRIDDINLEVMRKMDDITLSNFCRTNSYYKNLCEKTIWLERIRAIPGLSLLLPYRSLYKDLEDFYFNVRNDAQYVVTVIVPKIRGFEQFSGISVINDIQKAYTSATEILFGFISVEARAGRTDEELLRSLADTVEFVIMVRFDGVMDYERLGDYTIYSLTKGAPGYFNPNILSYPLLDARDVYVAVEMRAEGPLHNRSFIKYNTESLRQVHKINGNLRLFFKKKASDPVTNPRMVLHWMRYGFFDTYSPNPGLFLVDFDMLRLSPPGYQLILYRRLELHNGRNFDLATILTMTPEQLQQKIHDTIMDAMQTGELIYPNQMLSALRNYV